MRKWLDKWGACAAALLCAAVVALSAVYTRQEDISSLAARSAGTDAGETLEQAQAQAQNRWARPVRGDIRRAFQGAQKVNGVWQADPFTYFSCARGQAAYACRAGKVTLAQGERMILAHADGFISEYRGLSGLLKRAGDSVSAGERLGAAGDKDALRVSLQKDGAYVDIGAYLPDE